MKISVIIRAFSIFLIAGLSPIIASAQTATGPSQTTAKRPNILWITSEDNGRELGCYGDHYSDTPNIDQLAARGMKYMNCWSNAPVCAPARTTIISGMYPTSLGAEHMRSEVMMPNGCKLYPELLRDLGYYCTNNSKTDYNVTAPTNLWNESSNKAHWRNRPAGQPFFAVFNFVITHESQIRTRPHTLVHDPKQAPIPPYQPDTPEVRHDWAQYYDNLTEMDRQVGAILQQLKEDGLENDTIVFYYGDHGSGMPRGKRWLYQSGLAVPIIVYFPESLRSFAGEEYRPASDNHRLISFVDLAPTLLSILGHEPAKYHQGRPFLGKFTAPPPEYLYGFRGRMDERIDLSRAVRDQKYLYIRNFMPYRPQGSYIDYMFQTPTTSTWKKMFDAGSLNAAQSAFWKIKPAEELYDLNVDPHQINNLATAAAHESTLKRFRTTMHDWMLTQRDLGVIPEGELKSMAGASSPADVVRDRFTPARFESILDAAERSSLATSNDYDRLAEMSKSQDPIVRYWGASALVNVLARLNDSASTADATRSTLLSLARSLMRDDSPYVRCLAAECLGRWGNEADRRPAIEQLLEYADGRKQALFVSMAALNSLDWCRPSQSEFGSQLDNLPSIKPDVSRRYDTYIPNLIAHIRSQAKQN